MTLTSAVRAFFVVGPAGSGKSSVATLLAEVTGSAYLDKDTACTRFTEALLELAGTDKHERDGNVYYQDVVMDLEYETLLDLARDNLAVGRSVVLDAPFGRWFSHVDYVTEAARRHDWPRNVETVVVRVGVDGATARRRVRERALARDRSKLANWDVFWAKASAAECRWEVDHLLELDNRQDQLEPAAVVSLVSQLR